MRMFVDVLRRLVNSAGYDIRRYQKAQGLHADADIKRLIGDVSPVVVFDVGANRGQSVVFLKNTLPDCHMHCFEPLDDMFRQLTATAQSYKNVRLNNVAVGSAPGTMEFSRHDEPRNSSFLPPGEDSWSSVVERIPREITTIDAYCAKEGVPHIHLLKIDTQGFDFEVMKGAEGMMRQGAISLIYSEFIFCEQYQGITPYYDILKWLTERRFDMVSVYEQNHKDDRLSFADVLFARRN